MDHAYFTCCVMIHYFVIKCRITNPLILLFINVAIQKNLEDRSAQMRLVQRRFFVKVDDKKAGALTGISMLYMKTHQQIFTIIKEMEQSKRDLSVCVREKNLNTIKIITLLRPQKKQVPNESIKCIGISTNNDKTF